jgi:hypothetical protein
VRRSVLIVVSVMSVVVFQFLLGHEKDLHVEVSGEAGALDSC